MSTPQTYGHEQNRAAIKIIALRKKLLAIELKGEGLAKEEERIEFVAKLFRVLLKEYKESFDKGIVETKTRPVSPRTEPPRIAELLVGWCTKKGYRETLRDNLDEVFQRDLSNGMTVARARLRYWGGALNSITPQLLAAAKRIGIIGLIADYARRLLH
ncbi:MAG: hypothetical protein WBW81_05805 [Methylocella sp.]